MPQSHSNSNTLTIHTAVDFVRAQGVGIGLVQCATPTGRSEERKYGFKRSQLACENVKTPERANMLALLHALGLARTTIKRLGVHVQTLTVFCSSSNVCDIINHYLECSLIELEHVVSTNDRAMIRRVVVSVRELERRGVEVRIVHSVSFQVSEEAARVRTLARQNGSKACRSRRRARVSVAAGE